MPYASLQLRLHLCEGRVIEMAAAVTAVRNKRSGGMFSAGAPSAVSAKRAEDAKRQEEFWAEIER